MIMKEKGYSGVPEKPLTQTGGVGWDLADKDWIGVFQGKEEVEGMEQGRTFQKSQSSWNMSVHPEFEELKD